MKLAWYCCCISWVCGPHLRGLSVCGCVDAVLWLCGRLLGCGLRAAGTRGCVGGVFVAAQKAVRGYLLPWWCAVGAMMALLLGLLGLTFPLLLGSLGVRLGWLAVSPWGRP